MQEKSLSGFRKAFSHNMIIKITGQLSDNGFSNDIMTFCAYVIISSGFQILRCAMTLKSFRLPRKIIYQKIEKKSIFLCPCGVWCGVWDKTEKSMEIYEKLQNGKTELLERKKRQKKEKSGSFLTSALQKFGAGWGIRTPDLMITK